MGAQEACYHVLSMPLCKCSRGLIFINTSPQNERVRMLKQKKHLDLLEADSDDIYYENIIEKYANRKGLHLEQTCLCDFAASIYQVVKSRSEDDNNDDDDDNYEMKMRKKLKNVKYRRYKLNQDKHNYYREQILLFYHFEMN